jgi:crotonobetainyl-CoA:carnitine CoA-transferase CaiB-like acyl-CoA transferase
MYELLKGIRIVDLTTTYLGPYATQFLGDLGADVVKVESLTGDIGRAPLPSRHPEMGAGFINSNRNKRSLAVDLKAPKGRDVVLRLASTADAFVHNMRPKAAQKLGFAYADLKNLNPGLVYCCAAGFGQDGPYADDPAYDDIIQAMSGLARLNQDDAGTPRFLPSIVADKVMGLHLAFALASGLIHRLKTGEGCTVEAPMFESMVAFLLVEHLAGRSFEPPLGPAGYERLLVKNRRPYRTRDGYIAIMPYTTLQWTRFLECIGRADLLALDWVKDPVKRSANVDALYQLIADAAPAKTTEEWLALMKAREIPCGRANSLDDLFDEPHLKAVGLFENVTHPSEGAMHAVRSPFWVSGAAKKPDRPAPRLGDSSEAILLEAGFSAVEVRQLADEGVIRMS